MSIENKVTVITDSGCSVRPESSLANEHDLSIVPLDVKFFEKNHWVSYQDNADLPPASFYEKMRNNAKLPQTSGVITGRLVPLYEANAKENQPVISIHITSKHSTAWESAVLASNIVRVDNPHLLLEVIDSRQVSAGIWFLAQQAATLAEEGYPLEDIKKITLETIPKIETFTSLSTFENIVKGGRLPEVARYLGSKLQLRPFAGIVNGEIKFQNLVRTDGHVQREIIKRVENTKEDITRLAILHTNFPEGAALLKENLSRIYSKEILIIDAGPTIAVHTGERGLGISLQKV
ncbi:MAG TPA: DegV family protein [Candidatus Woesebacteria bacterium]|nr:DegV family protein [Candidatus Woesebacteria bacterium]